MFVFIRVSGVAQQGDVEVFFIIIFFIIYFVNLLDVVSSTLVNLLDVDLGMFFLYV